MESPDRRRSRYPFDVTISVAFTVLLAVFRVALIAFNYVESREMALVGADDLLDPLDDIDVEGILGSDAAQIGPG